MCVALLVVLGVYSSHSSSSSKTDRKSDGRRPRFDCRRQHQLSCCDSDWMMGGRELFALLGP